jgi:hypothetical protein
VPGICAHHIQGLSFTFMAAPFDVIAGARPNFVKIAPILSAMETARAEGAPRAYRLIQTGSIAQEIHVNVGVGGGERPREGDDGAPMSWLAQTPP